MSLIADILDTIEYKNGFRVDGISGSVYTVITTVSQGISTSIFNILLSKTGYVAPYEVSPGVFNTQTADCQSAISWCFLGFEAIAGIVLAVTVSQIKVENGLPEVISGLMQRKKELAIANGEEWIDPVEAAKIEEEENRQLEEQSRIEKLKKKCAKKGLDFEAENQKYQSRKNKKRQH